MNIQNPIAIIRRALLAAAVLCAGALPVAVHAAGVELKLEQFSEVEVVKAGKKEKVLKPLTKAAPGSEVVYVIRWNNKGAKPADNVVIRNNVPAELTYRAGSAQGDGTTIAFSVDGGKTFDVLEKLTVAGNDGKPRAATPADVTSLRWTLLKPAAPGAKGSVTYRAVVK